MSLQVLYGGTFDPVHDGHIAVARHARDALDATIRMMPAADPPHRGPTHADAAQRAAMLDLAVTHLPRIEVDRRELERGGPSYTVDTLRLLRAEVGAEAPWAILIGADSFLALDSWHHWRELFALAHVVVAERPGSPVDASLPPALAAEVAPRWCDVAAALHASPAGRVFGLRQPTSPVSATRIRHCIAAGEAWRDMVPAAVADYIVAQGLYRGPASILATR